MWNDFKALPVELWRQLKALLVVLINELLLGLVVFRRRIVEDPLDLPQRGEPVVPPSGDAPAGITAAWDTAVARLNYELAIIDQLDNKAGVIVAALVAAAGLLIASPKDRIVHIVLGLPLVFALGLAAGSFLVRQYEYAPEPEAFASAAIYKPEYMREAFLGNVLEAIRVNHAKSARKGLYLNSSVSVAVLTAIVALFVKMTGWL
jgi:hypothetical protein